MDIPEQDLRDLIALRHDLHSYPELGFEEERTSGIVARLLQDAGIEVHRGLGGTGVVGTLRAGNGQRAIGLRADMDALAMPERAERPYKSRIPGKMHACGHDGHTAMLLGAAKYLAETRNFTGAVAVIFQPAEEGGGGGNEMVKDGMMERFGISEVYGMHNFPGIPVGQFAIRKGAIMASTDEFMVTVKGLGGHAAMPHRGIDPVVIGAQIVIGLQTIASRNADPLEAVVVSVTKFTAGNAHNVIPNEVKLGGTVRTLKKEMRDLAEKRLKEVAQGIASAHGATVEIWYDRNYPVTYNHDLETEHAIDAAIAIAGEANVEKNMNPTMGGEDFSYMLESRPGAFIAIGNGETASLHHPQYDFNDEIIPHGISYWVKLAESRLAG